MHNEGKKIGIWIRVSTDLQVQGESPEIHIERAKMYAELKKWDVVETYQLDAVSGKSVMNHPTCQKMLKDIKEKKITGIIFSSISRLARNTRDLLAFADYFQEHDADIISIKESVDTSSPSGRFVYTMIAGMAQWEREEISERVAASVPIRAKMGKPLGGQAPYGYTRVEEELVLDENEAPVRKLMFELFLEYKRKGTVARKLNEKGYRTRKGSKWSDTSIARLLTDPIAKGLRRANYTSSRGDGKSWDLKPESEWVFQETPAIVSEEIWDSVNNIITAQKAKIKAPTRLNTHLLGGIAVCHCGGKMYVPSNSPKYVCNDCRNKIPKKDLHELYYEALKLELTSEKTYRNVQDKRSEVINERELQLQALKKEHIKVDEDTDQLFMLNKVGQLATEDFSKHYAPLKERKAQIEEEQRRLYAEVDYLKINTFDLEEVLDSAVYLKDNWLKLPLDDKRKLVRNCTQAIVIGESDITIRLIPKEMTSLINDGKSPTNPHGFILATSIMLHG